MLLGICVPVRDICHSNFAFCLSQLTANLVRNHVQYHLFFENGSLIQNQRYQLVLDAQRANCNQILWLDSDMVFPSNIYHTLSAHQKPVVAGTYSTRTQPYRNVAMDENYLPHTHCNELYKVHAVGMGIMLTDIEVYNQIPHPWFKVSWDYENDVFMGEDVYFSEQLQQYDYDIWIDPQLSNQCAHLSTMGIKTKDFQ